MIVVALIPIEAPLLSTLIFFFICIPPIGFTVPRPTVLTIPEVKEVEVEVEVEVGPNPKPTVVTPSLLSAIALEEEEDDEEDEEDEEVAACSALSRV